MHKLMLKVARLLVAFMILPGCTDASTNTPFLKAQERELHLNGESVQLRAICFSNYYNKRDLNPLQSNHHSKKDFQVIKDMGFNAIRFAFNGNWYENDEATFWQWLDLNIGWAREHGIQLILDLHVPIDSFWLAPQSPEASFAIWTDKSIRQRNIKLWQAIASRYKDEPVIAAYDILNEPVTSDSTGEQWQQLANEMVSAIREIDQNHLLVIERLYGVNREYSNTDAVQQFLIDDDNILYDFHFYEPIDYTHQYANWVANPIGDGGKYPDPAHLNPTGEQVLKPELRITTGVLSDTHEEWREYKSAITPVETDSARAAIPILTIRNGGSGSFYFDDIRIFEYDSEGNFLGEALHDPLSEISISRWWSWQLGDTNKSHANFKRETTLGKNDQYSLSIALDNFNTGATAGWSSDYNWIRVIPGHSYQLSVYIKTGAEASGSPEVTLGLDFYSNPDSGQQAFLNRDSAYLEHQFLKYYQFGIDNNVPVSVLETGLVRHAFEMPGKGGPDWVKDLISLFNKYNTSYAWWNYHGDQMGVFLSDQNNPPDNPNQTLIDALVEMQVTRAEPQPDTSDALRSPPGGLKPEQVPQFVVIGFDDNTLAAGLDWAKDLFENRLNADGSPARTSFYMNTHGLTQWLLDDPEKLKASLLRLYEAGHEIGNHTHNHHDDLDKSNWDAFVNKLNAFTIDEWVGRIRLCTESLDVAGIPRDLVIGFRAPYLTYNQAMLSGLEQQGFVYDTSIEEGFDASFDGTNLRWPYRLDQGSPGHNESWLGSEKNPDQVVLGSTALWELPNHVLMIPKDNEGEAYGIAPGLWQRMLKLNSNLHQHRITGFDYNLFVNSGLTGKEVSAILKYNLDLRLQGNRAPMMFGAHTQYYVSEKWVSDNAPQTNSAEMQAAIREFVDYALSKPEVRIRPARDIIEWMRNPQPIQH